MNAIEAALRRERTIVAAGLGILTLLSWLYVWRGAGMGMSALAMTRVTLFPHLMPDVIAHRHVAAAGWMTVVAMWWVMMIAMMTPSAAPMVLLYGRVLRHRADPPGRTATALVPTIWIAAGYLLAWLGFSIAATGAQYLLQRAGLVSHLMLWSRSGLLSGAILAAAGLYQFSPLKHACLRHCRSPAEFMARHWRPGSLGALVMGLRHGLSCIGCCWILMALLFVGGVMNLAWIALLALFVLVEKIAPNGGGVGRIAGGVLIVWAVATLVV